MNQSFFLTPVHEIHADEDGNYSLFDINLSLAVIGGWTLQDFTIDGDAIVVRLADEGPISRMVPKTRDTEEVAKRCEKYGLEAIVPLSNLQFAQEIMRIYPCVITPVVSNGGELRGLWHVESVGTWKGADLYNSGFRGGLDEYIETFSSFLAEAIGLNIIARLGVGKKAFMVYAGNSVTDAEIVFITERTLQIIKQDPQFMAQFVRVPDLDPYCLIAAPDDVIADVRTWADAQAVVQKAPYRTEELTERAAEEPAAPAEENTETEEVQTNE
ncbi:TPA: hypothetical protein LU109_003558 [Enterobacter hormaechei subsp. xiangfangensis]|nr:hypothetical protein [Enterobacter hormaechei subsp. xiangfangensis]